MVRAQLNGSRSRGKLELPVKFLKAEESPAGFSPAENYFIAWRRITGSFAFRNFG